MSISRDAEIQSTRSTIDPDVSTTPSVLDHLLFILKMWWNHWTIRVSVPTQDLEFLMHKCGLSEKEVTRLYKQFRLLISDDARDHLTIGDLERHSSLIAGNPLKKYTYRILFWSKEKLTFREFVGNLSLILSNSIGCRQLHLIKSVDEMAYFNNVTCSKDVVQIQKLLALFNCFDLKETGCLDTEALCPLLYDLLRCDSDVSLSRMVPHSMIRRMVNTAIACVHAKYPRVCKHICGDIEEPSAPLPADTVVAFGDEAKSKEATFDGHKMLLTKELFIRDQENMHLDQLLALRL